MFARSSRSPDAGQPRSSRYFLVYLSGSLSLILFIGLSWWRPLAAHVFASNYLPHQYCYLAKPGLIWTHVVADTLIALAYFVISGTLAFMTYKGRRVIPFQWIFLAFGLFIIACGATHFMEVVTTWIPVYVFSGAVKVFTAVVSVITAAVLPFTVPQILTLVNTARASDAAKQQFQNLAVWISARGASWTVN